MCPRQRKIDGHVRYTQYDRASAELPGTHQGRRGALLRRAGGLLHLLMSDIRNPKERCVVEVFAGKHGAYRFVI